MLHAHTYFPYDTEDHKAKATKFRAAVQSQCEGMAGVKLSTISPKAAGPHPMPEFELAFTKYCLKDILPWLIFNRPDEYSILVHPFTSDVVSGCRNYTCAAQAECETAKVAKIRQYRIMPGQCSLPLLCTFAKNGFTCDV